MTPDELRAIGQGVYDAINDQDTDRLGQLFAPGVVRHAAGEVGIGPALDAVRGAFAAAPDLRFRVEDLIADGGTSDGDGTGDRVALRVSVHRGDAPPSTILEIFRIEDGRVAEIWGAGTGPG